MLSDGTGSQTLDLVPSSNNDTNDGANGRSSNAKSNPPQPSSANFPPPKTDKPRPHVCGTCGRSFARLEHLKRHERSHTKEKPFECPECTRCFARRDLLLRHQQKLHMTTTTPSRPRTGRRESVSGVPNGRVRKNSTANSALGNSGGAGAAVGRPRANTISHLDMSSLGMLGAPNTNLGRPGGLGIGHSHHPSLSGLPGHFDYRGMSASLGNHGGFHGLPKLDTHSLSVDMGRSLRTAPPYANMNGFDFDAPLSAGNTINPAQLHFSGSLGNSAPLFPPFPPFATPQTTVEDEDDFGWMRTWDNQTSFNPNNDQAIDGSSPSGISSTASQSGFSEVMVDGSNGPLQNSQLMWQQSEMMAQAMAPSTPFSMNMLGSGLPGTNPQPRTLSPQSLQDTSMGGDPYFNPILLPTTTHADIVPGMPSHYFIAPSTNFSSDSPSISSSPMNDSARHSSVTSVSTESITDATRQALLLSLSQPSVFSHNHRKYSQPAISSPLSPGFGPRSASYSAVLPSTADLQRYVSAYIQYFHPHLPFLHISTLSFDSPDYISNLRTSSGYTGFGHSGIVGGGGCLILAMAAIGALYEYDHVASKDLFEAAKKMIQLYLEERRKADMSAAVNGANLKNENTTHNTPLWLVQAMLLNVIYGHQCGDKTAADIASTHCAALVSLARAAELAQPSSDSSETPFGAGAEEPSHFKVEQSNGDVEMDEDSSTTGGWKAGTQAGALEEHAAWCRWKIVEERKRTLFAVFILSSLLVTAYNHTPAIMNSEILLDLPCEEDLWAADSAQAWAAKGGTASMENNVSFAAALSRLLTANQRQQSSYSLPSTYHQRAGSSLPTEDLPESELKPSTFGCLVLINALHNYIWETRSRHHGRQWTTQETESMLSHIEPALKAWQSAWAANPHHKLERPNPFGFGPLSADSIPLLDLAFVRLFVNLGRSKEAFWQRDFETMADELARGAEIAQHAEQSPLTLSEPSDSSGTTNSSSSCPSAATSPSSVTASVHGQTASHKTPPHMSQSSQSSRRERHLRKAAFYAADSLGMAEKLNNTYADFTSRELPIQSAMCFFDCAQVLAEWASTLQERVGRYLGVLGKDEIDYAQVPAIMLLESEDVELLRKIAEILGGMETKILDEAKMMAFDIGGLDPNGAINAMNNTMTTLPGISGCGYGSKTLMVTAYMLEKAAVWPVTHVMARALETQAAHMNQRAEASLAAQ